MVLAQRAYRQKCLSNDEMRRQANLKPEEDRGAGAYPQEYTKYENCEPGSMTTILHEGEARQDENAGRQKKG